MKNKIRLKKDSVVSTSILVLMYIFVIILFYKKMPDQLPIHWGLNGQVDSYASKFKALVILPLTMLFLQIITCFIMDNSPRVDLQNTHIIKISKYALPITLLVVNIVTISHGMEIKINPSNSLGIAIGLLFIVIGNFLPKLKNNYVVGIKLPWTLNSDENWRRTHRLGGFTYVIGGLIILIGGLISIELLQIIGIILVAIPPIIYSFYLYTKGI